MGFLDNAKKQLKGAVDKHGDTIAKGLDKAAAEADKRTGGKHSDKIAKARSAAKDGLRSEGLADILAGLAEAADRTSAALVAGDRSIDDAVPETYVRV